MSAPKAGVIGVGSMGRNHARIYHELPDVDLVGVVDQDEQLATEAADEFGTEVLTQEELLAEADLVSVVVPTRFHYDVARECIEAGVDVLVEKPFVDDPERGRELLELADERDVVVQVGHIERFNPAVTALFDLVRDEEIIAVDARRLNPPPKRDISDGAVMDLMVHDIDIVLSLVGGEVDHLASATTRGGQYATAQLQFDDGVVGTLTASRVTQRKVRELQVTTPERLYHVDYIDQSVRIHRQSRPESFVDEGRMKYRNESITEEPMISTAEPLKLELISFVEASVTGSQPRVTGEDGIRTLEVARRILDSAPETRQLEEVTSN